MKRLIKFLFCTLIISLSTPINAQLLYKISGKNSTKPSYILATTTLIESPYLDSIPNVFKAYNNCTTVICELYQDEKDASKELEKASHLYMNSALNKLVSPAQFEWADSLFQSETKLKLIAMNSFKPYFSSQMYVSSLERNLFPYSSNDVIDIQSFFPYMASIDEKYIIGLTSPNEIINRNSNNQTIAQQLEDFLHLLDSKDTIKDFLFAKRDAYKAQDLEAFINCYSQTSLKYFKLQSQSKNQIEDWSKKIFNALNESPCFIVLNAKYLPGKNGLIKQLKDLKLKIKPVN